MDFVQQLTCNTTWWLFVAHWLWELAHTVHDALSGLTVIWLLVVEANWPIARAAFHCVIHLTTGATAHCTDGAPVSAFSAVWCPPEASPIFALLHTTKDQGAWACAHSQRFRTNCPFSLPPSQGVFCCCSLPLLLPFSSSSIGGTVCFFGAPFVRRLMGSCCTTHHYKKSNNKAAETVALKQHVPQLANPLHSTGN